MLAVLEKAQLHVILLCSGGQSAILGQQPSFSALPHLYRTFSHLISFEQELLFHKLLSPLLHASFAPSRPFPSVTLAPMAAPPPKPFYEDVDDDIPDPDEDDLDDLDGELVCPSLSIG